jgi:hypothetical protein
MKKHKFYIKQYVHVSEIHKKKPTTLKGEFTPTLEQESFLHQCRYINTIKVGKKEHIKE